MNNNRDRQSNFGDPAKPVLRGKFTVLKAYIRNEERLEINHPSFNLKSPGKEQQIKSKVSK